RRRRPSPRAAGARAPSLAQCRCRRPSRARRGQRVRRSPNLPLALGRTGSAPKLAPLSFGTGGNAPEVRAAEEGERNDVEDRRAGPRRRFVTVVVGAAEE